MMMTGSYLEKYPITSESGKTYLVIIQEDSFFANCVEVKLYKKLNKKTIFGREKIKALNVGIMGHFPVYNEEKWKFNYKDMAINEVEEYEKRIAEKIEEINKRTLNENKFNEWDGKIN